MSDLGMPSAYGEKKLVDAREDHKRAQACIEKAKE